MCTFVVVVVVKAYAFPHAKTVVFYFPLSWTVADHRHYLLACLGVHGRRTQALPLD